MTTSNFRQGNKSTKKLWVCFCKSLVIVSLSNDPLDHVLPVLCPSLTSFFCFLTLNSLGLTSCLCHHSVWEDSEASIIECLPNRNEDSSWLWEPVSDTEGGTLSCQWKYSWSLVLLKVLGHWKPLQKEWNPLDTNTLHLCRRNKHIPKQRKTKTKTYPVGACLEAGKSAAVLWPPGQLPPAAPFLAQGHTLVPLSGQRVWSAWQCLPDTTTPSDSPESGCFRRCLWSGLAQGWYLRLLYQYFSFS